MATKLKVNYEFVGDSTTPVTRTESIKHGDSMLSTVINAAAATVNTKADKTYVDTELAKKANAADVTTALSGKADNTTVSALDSRVGTAETNIATQTARIDNIANLPEGSTTGDAELIDIRVGADGKTYTSAGAAVRGQISDVKSDLKIDLNDLYSEEIILTAGTKKGSFNGTTIIQNDLESHIHLEKPLKYTRLEFSVLSVNLGIVFCIDENNNIKKFGNTVGNWEIDLNGFKEVYINFFGSDYVNGIRAKSLSAVSNDLRNNIVHNNSEINNIDFEIYGNINITPNLTTGYIYSSNGIEDFESCSDEDWKHTDYLRIPKNTKVIVHNFERIGTIACTYAIYDINKNFITSGGDYEIENKDNYAYIRLCNYDTSHIHSNKFIIFGSERNGLTSDIKPVYRDDRSGKHIASAGIWVDVSPAYPNFNYSDPVYLKSGTKIYVDTYGCKRLNSGLAVCAFFASDKNVESQTPTNVVSYALLKDKYEITVPNGYEYVVFNRNVMDNGATLIQPKITLDANYSLNQLAEVKSGGSEYAKLHMADEYSLVVGDLFELFWKGVIEAFDPYIYNIDVQCSVGNCYKRKFEYTPNSAGNYSMTVTLKSNDGTVLDTKTTVLKCKNPASSPSAQKNVLCVGDSLLCYGKWAIESHRRLTGNGGTPQGLGLSNINYIGICENEGVRYEGYSGYAYKDFNTKSQYANFVWITCEGHTKTSLDQHSIYRDSNGALWKLETIETNRLKMIRDIEYSTLMPSSGTLTHVSGGSNYGDIVYSSVENTSSNPFWNDSTNKVDFKNYANYLGVNSIDYCYVLLGGNSTQTPTEEYRNDVKEFINNLLRDFPNCKIGLMSSIVPCLDGCGTNYGCSWNWYSKAQILWNMFDMYSEIADEYENVHYINVVGQFDVENNMITSQRKVNARNNTLETYQSNGFHPAESGEMQIADVVYRDLNMMLQS